MAPKGAVPGSRPPSADETTGAVLFARAIVAESLRQLAQGNDPEAIRRGIDCAAEAAMDAFEKCWRDSGAGCASGDRAAAETVIAEHANPGPAGRSQSEASDIFRRKKARLDEALHALGCARVALSGMRGSSRGEDAGIAAVRFALDEPSRQIARLAGKDPEVIMNSVLEGMGQYGVVASNGTYADLVEVGSLDSHRAMRQALKCASALGGRAVSSQDPLFGALRSPAARSRFPTPRQT